MTLTVTFLNGQLGLLTAAANFNSVLTAQKDAVTQIAALESTQLTNAGDVVSGVKALSSNKNRGAVRITAGVPGLAAIRVQSISSGDNTNLNAITGATVSSGFLNMTIASSQGQGVKAALNQITNDTFTDAQMRVVLTDVVDKQYSNQVNLVAQKSFTFSTAVSSLATSVLAFNAAFGNLLGSGGVSVSISLRSVVARFDKTNVTLLTTLGVPTTAVAGIITLIANGEKAKAIKEISTYTNEETTIDQIANTVNNVSTKLTEEITFDDTPPPTSNIDKYDVNSISANWDGANTNAKFFTTIPSAEELRLEFFKSSREITEMVFYAYECDADESPDASDVHEYMSNAATAADGIGVHYVILRSGEIQHGRPINKIGEIPGLTEQQYSINVLVMAPENTVEIKPSETVREVMKAFYNVWPGGQVYGSDERDAGQVGIDIPALRRALGRVNTGTREISAPTATLIAARKSELA